MATDLGPGETGWGVSMMIFNRNTVEVMTYRTWAGVTVVPVRLEALSATDLTSGRVMIRGQPMELFPKP